MCERERKGDREILKDVGEKTVLTVIIKGSLGASVVSQGTFLAISNIGDKRKNFVAGRSPPKNAFLMLNCYYKHLQGVH